jgi:hypothetical protein
VSDIENGMSPAQLRREEEARIRLLTRPCAECARKQEKIDRLEREASDRALKSRGVPQGDSR